MGSYFLSAKQARSDQVQNDPCRDHRSGNRGGARARAYPRRQAPTKGQARQEGPKGPKVQEGQAKGCQEGTKGPQEPKEPQVEEGQEVAKGPKEPQASKEPKVSKDPKEPQVNCLMCIFIFH